MSGPTVNIQYNVPTYVFGAPAKQNSACTGDMRITPGVYEAMNFQYSNCDGVPINLTGWLLRLVFWYPTNEYNDYDLLASNLANIVLVKDLHYNDPYTGFCMVVMTDQETLRIYENGRSSLRWSIYMINDQGEVYPSQITSTGERFGLAYIDRSDLPYAELIKGTTIGINTGTVRIDGGSVTDQLIADEVVLSG